MLAMFAVRDMYETTEMVKKKIFRAHHLHRHYKTLV
jgi:hypothetical protein